MQENEMYFLFELLAKLAFAKYILLIKVRFAKNITKRPAAENIHTKRSKKNDTENFSSSWFLTNTEMEHLVTGILKKKIFFPYNNTFSKLSVLRTREVLRIIKQNYEDI